MANGVGIQLQLEAESDTRNVAQPRRQLAFVPTIVYNYVSSSEKSSPTDHTKKNVNFPLKYCLCLFNLIIPGIRFPQTRSFTIRFSWCAL